MVSSAGDFVNGDCLGWYDRDPDEVLPEGTEGLQIGYYKGGTSGAFKHAHTWRMPNYPDLPILYTRDISSDARLVNQGVFNLQVVLPPSIYVASAETAAIDLSLEFYCRYKCRFFVNDITAVLSNGPLQSYTAIANSSGGLHIYGGDSSSLLGLQNADIVNTGTESPPIANWPTSNWPGIALGQVLNFAGTGNAADIILALSGFGADDVSTALFTFYGSGNGTHGVGAPWSAGVLGGGPSFGLAVQEEFAASGTHEPAASHWYTVVSAPGQEVGSLASLGVSPSDMGFIWMINPATGEWEQLSTQAISLDTPVLWAVACAGASSNSDTAVGAVHVQLCATQRATVSGLTYGPATLEALCVTAFAQLSNSEKLKFGGKLRTFIRAVRHQRRESKRDKTGNTAEDDIKFSISSVSAPALGLVGQAPPHKLVLPPAGQERKAVPPPSPEAVLVERVHVVGSIPTDIAIARPAPLSHKGRPAGS